MFALQTRLGGLETLAHHPHRSSFAVTQPSTRTRPSEQLWIRGVTWTCRLEPDLTVLTVALLKDLMVERRCEGMWGWSIRRVCQAHVSL